MSTTLKHIRSRWPLKNRRQLPHLNHEMSLKPAAVLLTLTNNSYPEIWLGVRSQEMPTHQGEVALPGGKRSSTDDNLIETALRESHEEVGLNAASVEVIGLSHEVVSRRGFIITPVIGVISDELKLLPDGREMTQLFKAPIAFFADKTPEFDTFGQWVLPRWQYEGHKIWGVTARIIAEFLNSAELSQIPLQPPH